MSDIPLEDLHQIEAALRAGQKIQAIKYCRESTGMGLKEAKDFVDGLEGMLKLATPDSFRTTPQGSNAWQDAVEGALGVSGGDSSMSPETAHAITEALFAGRKIEAVKIYRDSAGGGLKESKEAMDALEDALRHECPQKFQFAAKRGCLGVLVAGGMLLALAGWV